MTHNFSIFEFATINVDKKTISFDVGLIGFFESKLGSVFESILYRDFSGTENIWESVQIRKVSDLNAQIVITIQSFLCACPNIKKISFVDCFDDAGQTILNFFSSLVSFSRKINFIEIIRMRCCDEKMADVLYSLQNYNELKILNISANGAGNKTAVALKKLIETNKNMKKITTNTNYFDVDAQVMLLNCVANAKKLLSYVLYFSVGPRNLPYDVNVQNALSNVFCARNCLKELKIGPFDWNDEQVGCILKKIATNQTIEHLWMILQTPMTQKRCNDICEMLEQNNTLKTVCFGATQNENDNIDYSKLLHVITSKKKITKLEPFINEKIEQACLANKSSQ